MRILTVAACGAGVFPATAQDADAGQVLFQTYCATCHGESARGDGLMADLLTVRPADLTLLTINNAGVFPLVRVVRRIDGRAPLLAHGGEMPLFGAFFEGEDTAIKAANGQPILTSRAIVDLTAWLQTIQN